MHRASISVLNRAPTLLVGVNNTGQVHEVCILLPGILEQHYSNSLKEFSNAHKNHEVWVS